MSAEFQSIAALIVVGLAAGWLVWRSLRKRRQPGCGGGCCPGPTRALKR